MRWNANGNGELGRAPKFLISARTPSLAFWLMTAGKSGSLKPRNVPESHGIPECSESRPNRFLEEADLSEPKSVRVRNCNSVVVEFGGDTVTLIGCERALGVQRTQERIGGSGGNPR